MAFESIPTILTAEELMDKAYGRAAKVEKSDRDRGHRWRKTILAQLEAVRNIIDDTLGKYVGRFPSLDQVAPYHKALIDLLIGTDRYRMKIGAVDRARHNIVGVLNQTRQQVARETDVAILGIAKKRAYGRVSSILRQIDPDLKEMADFRATLKRLPAVSPDLFTVVIAGYPNVGKSSLIRAFTRAEPEVASYPFTTKSANVGHMEVIRPERRFHESHVKIQLIDTPGLLDRPEEERNAIEHQATLALRHLADLVLFLRDPTGHCGFPVDVQERLLDEVRGVIEGIPLFIVETKTDVVANAARPEGLAPADFRISTVTGDRVDELRERLVDEVTKRPKDPALEAFLKGETAPSYRR